MTEPQVVEENTEVVNPEPEVTETPDVVPAETPVTEPVKEEPVIEAPVAETPVEPAAVEDVEKLVEPVEEKVDKFAKDLEGKTVQELRQIHSDALYAESELKRELYNLRNRAANTSTNVNDEDEKNISVHKSKLSEAVDWIRAVEKKLEGELKDITGINF